MGRRSLLLAPHILIAVLEKVLLQMSDRKSFLQNKTVRHGVFFAVVAILVAIPFLSMASRSIGSNEGAVAAPSVQSINLSSVISNGNAMVYDRVNNLAWVSELSNSIASINLNSVLTSGTSAVTNYNNIFPTESPVVGSLKAGASSITMTGGLVYTDANYTGGIAVASINPSTKSVSVYYSAISNFAGAMASKGDQVFISAGTGIVVFNAGTSSFSSVATYPESINSLVVYGSTVYFGYTDESNGQGGIGQISTTMTGLTTYIAGEPVKMIAFDSNGNLWFTGTDDLGEWNGATVVHNTFVSNENEYGPIGLVIIPSGIWVWGNAYHDIRFFQFSSSAFVSSSDIGTALRPWTGVSDSSGNVWGFELDGFTLIEIPNTFVSTVTTTVTSGPTTTITETVTTTSTSSTISTVTTTVTTATATATVTTTVTTTTTVTVGHGHCSDGGDEGNDNGGGHHGDWMGHMDGHWGGNGNGDGDDCGGGDDN
jgi:hypothetical protein